MQQDIAEAFKTEMALAHQAWRLHDATSAYRHVERAHIIGQRYFVPHAVTHLWLLRIGLARKDSREIVGQLVRLLAVVPGYLTGWVPKGNPGGAHVSALKPMPAPEDLVSLTIGHSVKRDMLLRAMLWLLLLTTMSIWITSRG